MQVICYYETKIKALNHKNLRGFRITMKINKPGLFTLSIFVMFIAAAGFCVLFANSASAAENSKPVALTGQTTFEPKADEQVDVAPFGETRSWDDGKDIGVLWEDAREIFKVVVTFANNAVLPDPSTVKLQYWKNGWPEQRVPRNELLGSGSSGWMASGDWYRGRWQDADIDVSVSGNTWTFTFRPINAKEFPNEKNFDVNYRQALKLRLLFSEKAPQASSFKAFTDSTWQQGTAVIEWGGTATAEQVWDGHAEAYNGYITRVDTLDGSKTKVNGSNSWTSAVKKTTDGIKVNYWFAKPASVNSFDETIITLRTKQHSFSFLGRHFPVTTIPDPKLVFIRDYGVLVKGADDPRFYSLVEQEYKKGDRCLYDRVTALPEQTLDRAWDAMPQKGRIYMPLAVEGGRQHFQVAPDGKLANPKNWLQRIKGSDSDKAKWEGNYLWYRIQLAMDGAVATGASIEDDYLPIPTTWYEKDGVRYSEVAFATVLSGKLPPEGRIKAEEPQVMMVKLVMANTGKDAKKASIPIDVWTSGAEPIVMKDGVVYSKLPEGELPRLCIDDNKEVKVTVGEKQLTFEADLAPGQSKEFYLAIPYLTPANPDEIAQLKNLKYSKQHKMIADYWRKRTDQGSQITTPEPMLNAFYRANISHQLINSECEVGSNDRYMAKVGTFNYGVYTNESVMMATEIDRRGYHDVAEKIYQAWIHYQGTKALPGDYTTSEGVFYGANGYEQGGYNQHHGWAMWGMGEHYWFTRDKKWLKRIAPNLIQACDWITTQRNRTKADDWGGIRAIEYGLLPPGSLEDIGDWRCWLSNNAFSWWGMDNVAKALADIGHPDAPRLVAEAAAYKEDIRKAFFEAMVRTPVVMLRDGTSIPNIPSEVHRRGRSFGWITETLEGSIHLVRCGLVDPDEPAAKWIMQDYEDNRYLSQQFGYQVADFEKEWFDLGGFSQQPSLLCSPTPYLMMDKPKQYLRSYFNAFAAGYFPERAMITEHPLPNLGDYGGDHFKSSDEAMNTSWIRFMYVWDEGNDLYLGKTIPRYWLADGKEVGIERTATHFGPMSMSIKSNASAGNIVMTIDPPTRNQPKAIYARFRHPVSKKITRVTVNGKAWDKFDAEKEWVILPHLNKKTVVVAYYN